MTGTVAVRRPGKIEVSVSWGVARWFVVRCGQRSGGGGMTNSGSVGNLVGGSLRYILGSTSSQWGNARYFRSLTNFVCNTLALVVSWDAREARQIEGCLSWAPKVAQCAASLRSVGFPFEYDRLRIEDRKAYTNLNMKENMAKNIYKKNIRGCVTYSTHGISRIVTKPWNKKKKGKKNAE